MWGVQRSHHPPACHWRRQQGLASAQEGALLQDFATGFHYIILWSAHTNPPQFTCHTTTGNGFKQQLCETHLCGSIHRSSTADSMCACSQADPDLEGLPEGIDPQDL